MGLGVIGMHYTGMLAASFVPNGAGEAALAGGLSDANLGTGIFAVTALLLAGMLSLSLLRQRQRAMVQI